MIRILTLTLSILIGLFSCIGRSDMNQTEDLSKPKISGEFKEILTTSYEYLIALQDTCKTKYDLNSYVRWDYDQETGLIEFSDSGKVKLRIKYEEVGSISKISNTWLWAWANPHLLEQVKSKIGKVKEFGDTMNYKILTKSKWYGDEYDAWEMTAISAFVLKAKGAYRIPSENTFSFIIFMEIEDLRQKE